MPIQNTDTHGSSHGPVSDSEMHVDKIQGEGGRGEGGLLSCAVYELYGDVQPKRVSHF